MSAADAIARCRAIVGGEADPFADEWRAMLRDERVFWLKASRLSVSFAGFDDWRRVPGDVRATLKNNLYRAAKRAAVLLGVPG